MRTKLTHNILLLNLRVEPPSPLKPINSIESRKIQIVIFYEILQPTYKYYVPKTSIKDTSGHRCLGTGMRTHQTTAYAYASIHVFHKFYSNFTPTYQEFKIRVILSFPYGVSVAPPPKQYSLCPVHLLAQILLYFVAVTCTQTRAKLFPHFIHFPSPPQLTTKTTQNKHSPSAPHITHTDYQTPKGKTHQNPFFD